MQGQDTAWRNTCDCNYEADNYLAAYLNNTLLELNAQLGPIIAIVKISAFHAASAYFFSSQMF